MGFLRLYLALSVLNAHYPIAPQPGLFVHGFVAVCIFFIISGFYMSLVLDRNYLREPGGVARFYFSRALRIFPVYWVVLALTVAAANLSLLAFTAPGIGNPGGISDLVRPFAAFEDMTLITFAISNMVGNP